MDLRFPARSLDEILKGWYNMGMDDKTISEIIQELKEIAFLDKDSLLKNHIDVKDTCYDALILIENLLDEIQALRDQNNDQNDDLDDEEIDEDDQDDFDQWYEENNGGVDEYWQNDSSDD